jgi:hypothetical protein
MRGLSSASCWAVHFLPANLVSPILAGGWVLLRNFHKIKYVLEMPFLMDFIVFFGGGFGVLWFCHM